MQDIAGIDYGSKLAGTTVITHVDDNDHLVQVSSKKRQDADQMLLDYIKTQEFTAIYIDAPLSLPNALLGTGSNYFYRLADNELRAMSPMFLGGLTARAIQLRDKLSRLGVQCHEVYPGGLVRQVIGKEHYTKKDKAALLPFLRRLSTQLPIHIDPSLFDSWHAVDSVLAWYSGYRHQSSEHISFGDPQEGLIMI